MNWNAYDIPPIDYNWEYLKTIDEMLSTIAKAQDEQDDTDDLNTKGIQTFLNKWQSAKETAEECGWEGDFNGSPRVFCLPLEGFDYGFVFKQSNNGTTFVISPQPLPWLDSLKLTTT